MNASKHPHGTRGAAVARWAMILMVAVGCQSATQAAENSPCRVVDVELQGSYSGGCVDGLAEGRGVASGTANYEGEFKAGRKHGRGVKTWPTGDRYEGEFKDDTKDGQGTYVWGPATPWSGEKYSGLYHNDKRDGVGTYLWPDGERYTGRWRADAVAGVPTSRMLVRTHDQRVRLAAVSKTGLNVCRQMRVGSVVTDWVRGTVTFVDGGQLTVRIDEPGQFEHRIQGVLANKDAVIRDWALMWTPCR